MKHLEKNDIACKIYYPLALHLQEVFKYLGYKKGDFPVAEKYSSGILALPMYPELTNEQASAVIEVIAKLA